MEFYCRIGKKSETKPIWKKHQIFIKKKKSHIFIDNDFVFLSKKERFYK